MAVTNKQRLTRFLKRNKGVCPDEFRELYKAAKAGAEDAFGELMLQVETDDDREDDESERLAKEELSLSQVPVMFSVSQVKSTPEPIPQKKSRKKKPRTDATDAPG